MSSSVSLRAKAATTGLQSLWTDPGGEGETVSHEQTGKGKYKLTWQNNLCGSLLEEHINGVGLGMPVQPASIITLLVPVWVGRLHGTVTEHLWYSGCTDPHRVTYHI